MYRGIVETYNLAEQAGLTLDTPGLKFEVWQPSHMTDPDGGYGFHNAYRVYAAGELVRQYEDRTPYGNDRSTDKDIHISGPWDKVIDARLKEIGAEAEKIIELREKNAAAKKEADELLAARKEKDRLARVAAKFRKLEGIK